MDRRLLIDGIPQSRVAVELRVSRPTVTTRAACYRAKGEPRLADQPSCPRSCSAMTPVATIPRIEPLRREHKWSARWIHHHLTETGYRVHLRTVGRWLHRLGIFRARDLTSAGEELRRTPQRIRAGFRDSLRCCAQWRLGRSRGARRLGIGTLRSSAFWP